MNLSFNGSEEPFGYSSLLSIVENIMMYAKIFEEFLNGASSKLSALICTELVWNAGAWCGS